MNQSIIIHSDLEAFQASQPLSNMCILKEKVRTLSSEDRKLESLVDTSVSKKDSSFEK